MQVKTILAIECSSELCSVALQHQGLITLRSALSPREHAYLVLPFVEELLTENALNFSDLQGIAFGQGPGAFTGLRVAASMAQGLALAHDLPLYAACSLHVLAKQVVSDSPIHIVSVLDARMSELYWAVYEKNSEENLCCISEASLHSPEAMMKVLFELNLSNPSYFIGPGCRHLLSFLNEKNCMNISNIYESTECFPNAKDLFSLIGEQTNPAASIDKASEVNDLPMPVYVRNDVAAKSNKKWV